MSVKVDRKRKIPVTTLLRALPRVVPEFTAVAKGDQRGDPGAVRRRRRRHATTTSSRRRSTRTRPSTAEEALLEFYRRLRPGDPPNADNARSLLNSLFFNFRRYDLGKVGRYKVNKRLGLRDADITERILTPDDLVEIVREMVRINNGKGTAGRHRPPRQPPRARRRRADPEPVPRRPAAHGARGQGAHVASPTRPRPRRRQPDQHPPGRGGDARVLRRQPALASSWTRPTRWPS